MPKPPQPPQLQGNGDHQLKPQLPSEFQAPPQGQAQDVGGDAERSLAWRIPLLRFIIEARTVLNVSTSDHRVRKFFFHPALWAIGIPYSTPIPSLIYSNELF